MSDPVSYQVAPYRDKAYYAAKRRELSKRAASCNDVPCKICDRARDEALREIDAAIKVAV